VDKVKKWKVESKYKSEASLRGMGPAAVGGSEELARIFATSANTARANIN
jgi:hypothetical protein